MEKYRRIPRRDEKNSVKLGRFENGIPVVIIDWAESGIPSSSSSSSSSSVRKQKKKEEEEEEEKEDRRKKGGLINGLCLLGLVDKLSQGVHSPFAFRRDSRNIPNAPNKLGERARFCFCSLHSDINTTLILHLAITHACILVTTFMLKRLLLRLNGILNWLYSFVILLDKSYKTTLTVKVFAIKIIRMKHLRSCLILYTRLA